MASLELDGRIEQRYQILRHIGSGAYGVVWCALDRHTETLVALKKVYDAFGNQQDSQRTYREVMLLRNLQHECVVKLLNVIRAVNNVDLYLVFELLETDLTSILRKNILNDTHRQYISYQIVKTIAFLHAKYVIHRDIKPSNIFVNSDCNIKIGDFGLARCINVKGKQLFEDLTDYIATRWYRSPEILVKSTVYTTAMDMWALGCVIAEMYTGQPLFMGSSTIHQLTLIVSAVGKPSRDDVNSLQSEDSWNYIKQLPTQLDIVPLERQLSDIDPKVVDLINRLIVFNPEKRLNALEALNHPYFSNFVAPRDLDELQNIVPLSLSLEDHVHLPAEKYKEALYHVIDNDYRKSNYSLLYKDKYR